MVSNKVIFKTGVLQSVEAYDGGSLVKTENLKWDILTGRTTLTRVNTNFDAPIYSLSTPAYHHYAGMGPAYQNAGLTYELLTVRQAPYKTDQYQFTVREGVEPLFYPGDELLLYGAQRQVVGEAVFLGRENNQLTLQTGETLNAATYTGFILRSGYRNQLNVDAGTVTALKDPTPPKSTKTYSKTVRVPVAN